MTTTCKTIQLRLLEEAPDAVVMAHLGACAECQAFASLMRALPAAEFAEAPPPALDSAIRQAARDRLAKRPLRFPRVLLLAAAAAIAICLGILAIHSPPPVAPQPKLAQHVATPAATPATDSKLLQWHDDELNTRFVNLDADMALMDTLTDPGKSIDSIL